MASRHVVVLPQERLNAVLQELCNASATSEEGRTMAKPRMKPCRLHGLEAGSLPELSATSNSPDSPLGALDDLLSDIRRSRTASLASTPTALSSEGEAEGYDSVRSALSKDELKRMDLPQLRSLADSLAHDIVITSDLLVRLLHTRDRRASKLTRRSSALTTALRHQAQHSGVELDLQFSLTHPEGKEDHLKWLAAWKVLARTPPGVPKPWRWKLWCSLAEHGTRMLDWPATFRLAFSEVSTPHDESLGVQIVKDLHRTGNAGFTTEEEHAVLKRVLLAYARFNQTTGYCQGFNIIAALILRVMNFDEEGSLKVMVYLVDHVLPNSYFARNLHALSVDMAVFRDLLHHFLPALSDHMDQLRRNASGTVKTNYSSDSPPDEGSIQAYEPPLTDTFSMQWFLTLFATSLPRKATRMLWDAILLEGSDMLVYAAVAVLTVFERDLLKASNAADFYSTMAQLGEKMRKAYLIPSTTFLMIVYALRDSTVTANSSIPNIKQLREQYTYNIYPCMPVAATEPAGMGKNGGHKQCPQPSRGGSFLPLSVSMGHTTRRTSERPVEDQVDEGEGEGRKSDFKGMPVNYQIKKLGERYASVARQPSVSCDLALAMPQARVVCPQTRQALFPLGHSVSYAADVPNSVLQHSRMLSHGCTLEFVQHHCQSAFTLQSFPGSHLCPPRAHPLQPLTV